MKQLHNIIAPLVLSCLMLVVSLPVLAQEQAGDATSQTQDGITPKEEEENTVDVKEIVFGHIGDSYEWHITTWGKTQIIIPLPIIVYSGSTGWHVFLSSRLEENGGTYEGLSIAPAGSKYEGKLVEYNAAGEQVRPWDISITKVTFALLFNSVLLLVNIFGTKHYWKDIFWPDVPWWLKVPVPMMPFIEFFGIFTKPFALMIRLFANMLAGHMAMLVLTCLIFISASMGPALNGTLTVASVLFNIFMNALELLVAFIQAYVFTMLSAVFIGLAQEGAKVKAE